MRRFFITIGMFLGILILDVLFATFNPGIANIIIPGFLVMFLVNHTKDERAFIIQAVILATAFEFFGARHLGTLSIPLLGCILVFYLIRHFVQFRVAQRKWTLGPIFGSLIITVFLFAVFASLSVLVEHLFFNMPIIWHVLPIIASPLLIMGELVAFSVIWNIIRFLITHITLRRSHAVAYQIPF